MPWSRVLEKLIVTQPVKVPAFVEPKRFITVFTRAHPWFLFSATCLCDRDPHNMDCSYVGIYW